MYYFDGRVCLKRLVGFASLMVRPKRAGPSQNESQQVGIPHHHA
jgi:hypothetical protein